MATRRRRRSKRKGTRKQRGGNTEPCTAVLIEPRVEKRLLVEFIIQNILGTLGSNWSLKIFHGPANEKDIQEYISGLSKELSSRITLFNLGIDSLSTKEYNDLMMSDRILKEIPTEMFLVVQTDSMLCKAGIGNLRDFMEYDYVGAPWKDTGMVGNGGFSLRRKSVMMNIVNKCSKFMSDGTPHSEDGFFSFGCDGAHPKKPTPEIAKKFAMETIYSDEIPVGIHKTWFFLPHHEKDIADKCTGYDTLRNLNIGQSGGNVKPLKIGLMAIFKNESMIMREWIEHYKWQGVDTIILLNNNSDDDWRSIVKDYEGFVTVKDAPEKYAQIKYYNTVGIPFLKSQGVDVLVVADFDEYYFGRDGKLLKEYIQETFSKNDRPSSVICGWAMFGSNRQIKQPASVRKGFTMRWSENTEPANGATGKSIMMISDIHNGKMTCQHAAKMDGRTDQCPPGLQLNHYPVMSKEYFDKVKATRGDVFIPLYENIRDEKYRKQYDSNIVKETLLAEQVAALA